jgi:nucleotide-binding universal stress UspA family protein
MVEHSHPCVVVGVDDSLTGYAALRVAVGEARRRSTPLYAVRAENDGFPSADTRQITAAFLTALGGFPRDVAVCQEICTMAAPQALVAVADDRRDLIVVGNSGKGAWHAFRSGSVSRALVRRSRCPVLAVPAPEMAREMGRAVGRPGLRGRLGRGGLWERFEQELAELYGVLSAE